MQKNVWLCQCVPTQRASNSTECHIGSLRHILDTPAVDEASSVSWSNVTVLHCVITSFTFTLPKNDFKLAFLSRLTYSVTSETLPFNVHTGAFRYLFLRRFNHLSNPQKGEETCKGACQRGGSCCKGEKGIFSVFCA